MTAPLIDAVVLDPVTLDASGSAAGPMTAIPRRRKRAPMSVWICAGWLIVIATTAVTADLLPLADPGAAVGRPRLGPSWSAEFLGTDFNGRSHLARVVFGLRASLLIGLGAAAIAATVGMVVGLVSGYYRGWVDSASQIVVDVALAFPPLVLLLAVTTFARPSALTLTVALAVVVSPAFSRLARANTMALADREFVQAARVLGARNRTIITREIFPNVLLPVASYSIVVIATVMVAEGSLSFLGLGIPPPTPSLGGMVAAAQPQMSRFPWPTVIPAVALLSTVYSLNVVGDHVRQRAQAREGAW